jgi:lipid A 3-O-deacylase
MSILFKVNVIIFLFISNLFSVFAATAISENLDLKKAASKEKIENILTIDNDSFLDSKQPDKFYTSGLRFARQQTLSHEAQSVTHGWRIGQDIYTAASTQTKASKLRSNDHPYAAWLYGGIYKDTYQADGSHLKLGLDLGCIGPCAGGEELQTLFHKLVGKKLPQGWSSQVKTEIGAVLRGSVGWAGVVPASWVDFRPSIEGRFGNINTDVSGVVTLRVGLLNTFPDQPTRHAFLRTETRVVAYDASLQGGYFSSDNTNTVRPKSVVNDVQVGFSWQEKNYGFRASIVKRSNEIREATNAFGAHKFVRFQFIYAP